MLKSCKDAKKTHIHDIQANKQTSKQSDIAAKPNFKTKNTQVNFTSYFYPVYDFPLIPSPTQRPHHSTKIAFIPPPFQKGALFMYLYLLLAGIKKGEYLLSFTTNSLFKP